MATDRAGEFYVERLLDLTEVDLATLDFGEKIHINGLDYFVANVTQNSPITQPAMALLVRV